MTIKQVLKKHVNYNLTGYLYRYGLVLLYKDNKGTEKYYFKKNDLQCSNSNFTRVVLHNVNMLYFGLPRRIRISEHRIDSEQYKKSNIDVRTIQFVYSNHGIINFDEQAVYSKYYNNDDIHLQGNGYFDRFKNDRLDTINGLSEACSFNGYIELN